MLAIADELDEDELVLRYRVEETEDGFSGEEGNVHHLLLLAGVSADRDREGMGPSIVRETLVSRHAAVWDAEEIDPHSAAIWGTSRRPSPIWP